MNNGDFLADSGSSIEARRWPHHGGASSVRAQPRDEGVCGAAREPPMIVLIELGVTTALAEIAALPRVGTRVSLFSFIVAPLL